jgi:hypothetical protein
MLLDAPVWDMTRMARVVATRMPQQLARPDSRRQRAHFD